MSTLPSPNPVSPYILLGMTATTGIFGAVSLFLSRAAGRRLATRMTSRPLHYWTSGAFRIERVFVDRRRASIARVEEPARGGDSRTVPPAPESSKT
jgi:hypothetical protein